MEKVFRVSAFCPCIKCVGKTDGITKSKSPGQYIQHSVAAPSIYPFGTKIILDGYGTFTVDFRGGAIKGNRIERYFTRHEDVVNWGVKLCKGKVVY